ncbi:MAG: bifunctional 2-polyprenyl-6-hydroxyphenol methylase/3-demethylubiquinol 3-O-methyltransferase UbiG [Pseudomonadales bacterium]|jgi:2-polyprenyl-6-hydroxyphenyl methylase/3-demethylubiquinone-9 3-methyltransferase|uniref:Ubiquinone biosynthesis O-methyltransferase n=1 Tax=OM182 bacterium TaxID=2510334 RepID=A0A520S045_9GAMM|nr:bifunctional 3-demethylubiquinol 3-O-methyltransferase/2-polyprenyl-6-hydroxyphenol methylase [Gammaproteobacteria bacterium]MBL6744509.1 bifunctional 2-polyprenyl-6-hydroxyphenol methylase/3-demethylubiquinol 3-O-methyltransferase UbiG [Pseudomonadales bacterium]RPG44799.1 MAG: bifunctional 2-polyprenyl-6-hydroxyphenol methylase/3-demethylubiquinol 3-O-methyltransferase UbiG [Gammaproteobacteria bacterium TMED163]RZO75838.1 MAG: bifunctional 2-polyprenyl-6-hydroxyphenol methylase/3-demethylu|tara:strand:+ start:13 stop:714 length:702 start_codon:yes stop_codon:yes gene_type:complete
MENVDNLEISKFEALASRWWDPESEFKPLHDINPLRVNYISQKINLAEKQVLDIGCGGGILAEAMAHHGAKVTAIDKAEASLSVAKLHLLESKLDISYIDSTAEEFAADKPEQFDVVTCLEMLEHVPDPASVVAACQRMVKPGGLVFFSTINRNPKSYLFAIVGAEYILNLLPRGTHDYAKLIKPSELAAWARDSDLELQDQIGMGYNLFTKRYFLQQNLDVNYLACYQKPTA